MTTPTLSDALAGYQNALQALKGARKPDPAAVLAALTARDVLARTLIKDRGALPEYLLAVTRLDKDLEKLAGPVRSTVNLADWRASLRPSSRAWWWSLDTIAPPGPADRFDWLWTALTMLCLTASLSLAVAISQRFLSGRPDAWGAFATLCQAALALLAAGGALTQAGHKAAERIMSSLKVPRRFHREWKLIMALVLLALLFGFWFSLPAVARLYNDRGYGRYEAGRLTSALYDLKRAVSLSPDYPHAHYNLGLAYEALLDVKQAQAEYQVAVLGGLDAAHNNLARLYILQGEPAKAVCLLLDGLERTLDPRVRYTMLKNLGWARLDQERYDEAIVWLHEAIALSPEFAAAHCLLAQAHLGQEDDEATQEWEACLKYANIHASPEEDRWIGQARQFLVTPTPRGQP